MNSVRIAHIYLLAREGTRYSSWRATKKRKFLFRFLNPPTNIENSRRLFINVTVASSVGRFIRRFFQNSNEFVRRGKKYPVFFKIKVLQLSPSICSLLYVFFTLFIRKVIAK
ncbi:hypothetical protein CDAR_81901 [Caerostris darwini]|uniref:Ribosomal protein L20 n=1 Tax=Caerostris darwini TaxID=1538125 RepID=A0AAV4V6D3_9ARAC|nr:hypothetical protein CDAR_81901 [Caerostris darwini]